MRITTLLLTSCLLSGCARHVIHNTTPPDYLLAVEHLAFVGAQQPLDKELLTKIVKGYQNAKNHPVVDCRVEAIGLPANAHMTLKSVYSGYADLINMQVFTNSEGQLRTLSDNEEVPVVVTVDATPGARTILFLLYDNEQEGFALQTKVTPRPLVVRAVDGSQLEVIKLDKCANIVYVECTGFQPNEELHLIWMTDIYQVPTAIQANPNGVALAAFKATLRYAHDGNAKAVLKRNGIQYVINYAWTKEGMTGSDEKRLSDAVNIFNARHTLYLKGQK